jgi:hypothetical protein
MEEIEMGRACGSHGEEDKFVRDFGGDSRRKETARKT